METEEKVETCLTGPGGIYVPSTEPRGVKNIGEEPVTFLCCITNVYAKEEVV